ncbi:MAG: archaellin/type IV pilin N-terminal domain-containing protein [Candidatus Thermoplasmatota archaeon]
MKANQAFRTRDDAVSPVIAVILMVAITVVLAATVYVWVSGFGAQSGTPAKTISLSSSNALSNTYKNYTVASATSGMKWSDISITIDGVARNQTLESVAGACTTRFDGLNTEWQACSGATPAATTAVVTAGDQVSFASVTSGSTLRVLDTQANSVILTLTIG